VDWVKANRVVPVKDQAQCGSCWAFSAVGSTESAYAIKHNTVPISLSEQELVDCSGAQGNHGCSGGLMDQAFQFEITNHGLCTEAAYPYEARDDTCRDSTCKSAFCITGFKNVPANNEGALQAAVAQQPVSVAVDAAGADWQFYSGGVMKDACGTSLDHGVLAVGYAHDATSGLDYWTVKNSWGTGWGLKGFVLLKRGTGSGHPGECGIAMMSSYPTGASAC